MTLQELKNLPNEMLTPAQVASFIGVCPQALRVQSRVDPDSLGFPVTRVGNRLLYPRRPLIAYITGCTSGEIQ